MARSSMRFLSAAAADASLEVFDAVLEVVLDVVFGVVLDFVSADPLESP